MQFCVTTIATAVAYSLSFDRTQTDVRVLLNFWSGNIHYQVCMGTGPRGLYLPKGIRLLSQILVLSRKLPRPSKFIEQSIAFCKAFCRGL